MNDNLNLHHPNFELIIGSIAKESLQRTECVTIYYHENGFVFSHEDDSIILHKLSEEQAIQVLVVLGKTDEEIEAYLERRSNMESPSS